MFAVHIPATEELAIKLASEASEAAFDPSNRFFFTDDANVANKTEQNKDSSDAGLLAIARCLSLAATNLLRSPNQQRAPKITVFTHHQDALRRINGARNIGSTQRQCPQRSISTHHHIDSTTEQVQATPALLEVVKKSRFLCRKLGAKVTLQWMPYHATAERYRPAETATSQILPASILPSFQRLRQDKTLTPSQRAYHRRELVRVRRSNCGRPSPLAQQATSVSDTTEPTQAETRHLMIEELRNLRISDERSII